MSAASLAAALAWARISSAVRLSGKASNRPILKINIMKKYHSASPS